MTVTWGAVVTARDGPDATLRVAREADPLLALHVQGVVGPEIDTATEAARAVIPLQAGIQRLSMAVHAYGLTRHWAVEKALRLRGNDDQS